jgi:hypothetical protein
VKIGDRVWIERVPGRIAAALGRTVPMERRCVLVVDVHGDFVRLDIPGHTFPKAFHRRTGRCRRGNWKMDAKHCDPRAAKQRPL